MKRKDAATPKSWQRSEPNNVGGSEQQIRSPHSSPLTLHTIFRHHVRPRRTSTISLLLAPNANDSPQRSAALRIEWAKLTTTLGLKGQTAAQLQAFKKRNEDARRKAALLHEQPQDIDFAHYRSILKNTAVIDEIEAAWKAFKPKTYDVSKTLAAIDQFEAAAVKNAETTKSKVDAELRDLSQTLKNIEEARSFDQLTVVCIPLAACRRKRAFVNSMMK
jgi:F-type H+-transporting ATPase subunit d